MSMIQRMCFCPKIASRLVYYYVLYKLTFPTKQNWWKNVESNKNIDIVTNIRINGYVHCTLPFFGPIRRKKAFILYLYDAPSPNADPIHYIMFFRLSYTCIYSSYFDFVYFSHWIPLLMLLFFRFSLFIIILRIMCLSRIIGYFPIPGVSDYVKLAIAVIDFQLN